VAEYIASHPPAVRSTLTRVRRAIRKAVPQAEESISYQIPAYKLVKGSALDIPAKPSTSLRCLLARFARLARYAVAATSTKFAFEPA
jgi:hypothetical protein